MIFLLFVAATVLYCIASSCFVGTATLFLPSSSWVWYCTCSCWNLLKLILCFFFFFERATVWWFCFFLSLNGLLHLFFFFFFEHDTALVLLFLLERDTVLGSVETDTALLFSSSSLNELLYDDFWMKWAWGICFEKANDVDTEAKSVALGIFRFLDG